MPEVIKTTLGRDVYFSKEGMFMTPQMWLLRIEDIDEGEPRLIDIWTVLANRAMRHPPQPDNL